MITYLKDGWYTRTGERRLRNEVVDGAIDTASVLFRASVPTQAITSLALKIRALATIAEPPHRAGMVSSGFAPAERTALGRRMQSYTDRFPPLQAFIVDSLEHVHNANELRALYLHLVHVTQMMQLLMVAKLSGAASGILGVPRASGSRETPAAGVSAAAAPATQAKKKLATKKKKPAAKKRAPAKKTAAKKVSKRRASKRS